MADDDVHVYGQMIDRDLTQTIDQLSRNDYFK